MDNEETLRAAGFARIHKRRLLVSRDRRMAFSHEALRDHDSRWLGSKLLEDVPDGEFRFQSNSPLNLKVCMEILEELGLSALTPMVPAGIR